MKMEFLIKLLFATLLFKGQSTAPAGDPSAEIKVQLGDGGEIKVQWGAGDEINPNIICGGSGQGRVCQDISKDISTILQTTETPSDNGTAGTLGAASAISAYGRERSEEPTTTHSCDTIRGVPSDLTFITRYRFYSKYTEAYGIPVVSSARVTDPALKRACYILRFLFADRQDTRRKMYKNYGRFAVIGINEGTTTIPEHSHLPAWWNQRARGLGAMVGIPVSTGGEENLLCLPQDRYRGDDIYFHEASHAVAELAIRSGAVPGFYPRLQTQYNYAKRYIKEWRNTYALNTVREYFAEGTQSFFNCHVEGRGDGIHGIINTRQELLKYDPRLYNLLKEVFPCMNNYQMCPTGTPADPRMDCDGSTKPVTDAPVTAKPATGATAATPTPPIPPIPATTQAPTGCTDKNRHCAYWAKEGYCTDIKHTKYMKDNCCDTCRKTCPPQADSSSNCPYWASNGECTKNPSWMLANCKKSCGVPVQC